MGTPVIWPALVVMAVAIVGLMMVPSAEQRTRRTSNSRTTEQRLSEAPGAENLRF
ncbi:hypothetical protein [Agromyces ramosus]|uniref:Secreted protein with PEP-CTERM sorting signal n=1 Tax=Agromyces ramosus TaxID=33879 RepID=A0ABU0R9V6_9MICO|nr:hypothetical protein [Agromyces ramosus]MDQ0894850.1 hypothetical protein [Agromyces ramosus]